MKKLADSKTVKSMLCLVLACIVLAVCTPSASAGIYQHGVVVRMRMGECLAVHHSFMVAMGGAAPEPIQEACPEYTLVSDKVVFVIIGRSSNQVIPLADEVDFRFHNNELAMRIDDARHEAKFSIKEMVLRSEWDLVQKHIAEEMNSPHTTESSLVIRGR
jgi:hypothetical protein